MARNEKAAPTPAKGKAANNKISQPDNSTNAAQGDNPTLAYALTYAQHSLGNILEALAERNTEGAEYLSDTLKGELANLSKADRVKALGTIDAWITANANGNGSTIRALLGIEAAPRMPKDESADIRESLIGQNLEAAEELEPSQERDKYILASVKALAQLPPLAMARWKPSFEKLGIDTKTLGELLKAERERLGVPQEASETDGEPIRQRYIVKGGALHSVEQSRDGIAYPKKLCNFTAKIVEDVAHDNGQDFTRRFVITGRLETGKHLQKCQVDSAVFAQMNWIVAQWGVRAVINAGQSTRDKIREAIQLESQEAASRTVYTHTGWREIDGRRVYLTTAGALGMEGVTVELDGGLRHYALPTSLEGVNLKKAMQASLRALGVAPGYITVAMLGAMYLAPLAEVLPLVFVIWLFGQSGSLKSTLAALFLSHYGTFTYNTLPEGWSSTDNILEKQTFTIKDAPLVIDDFAPQTSGIDAQAYERKAAKLIRAIGNQSPRNRMNADTSTRPGYRARGLVISTGEQLPSGQSIIARTLPIEVKAGSVNMAKLTKAQGESELYAQAMAGYIAWLGERWETLKADLPQRQRALRDQMAEGATHHLRTPEMFASVLLGFQLMLEYAQHVEALTADKAQEYLDRATSELRALATNQADLVKDERESSRFLNVLRALIAQGNARIEEAGKEGKGELLGWADADNTYLLPEATFHIVAKFCRDEGQPFTLKPRSLYKMLEADGLLVRGAKESTRTERDLNQKPHRVIVLKRLEANLCD